MAKIGILGGTFDPIHNAHLALGAQALKQFDLDQIWFMPSGTPPHKRDRKVTDGIVRSEMVKLAIAGVPSFVYSDFELKREGNTYTAQTLSLLKETWPQHEFYFIIGADSLYQLETWFHPELVMERTVLLVAGRPYNEEHRSFEEQISYLEQKYHARIYPIDFGEIGISSEEIRKKAANGDDFRPEVPEAVADYIEEHRLYRSP
jgi:nicotinate-nucleotide adenylyltransferase